jgi:hypothetical protein
MASIVLQAGQLQKAIETNMELITQPTRLRTLVAVVSEARAHLIPKNYRLSAIPK